MTFNRISEEHFAIEGVVSPYLSRDWLSKSSREHVVLRETLERRLGSGVERCLVGFSLEERGKRVTSQRNRAMRRARSAFALLEFSKNFRNRSNKSHVVHTRVRFVPLDLSDNVALTFPRLLSRWSVTITNQ